MADTRCANAEYQLEVDIMMIEYILYKAIHAQLRFLELSSYQTVTSNNDAETIDPDVAVEARGLSEIYDTLIRLFESQHGIDKLSEAARIDADMLSFIVLTNVWLFEHSSHGVNAHNSLSVRISTEMAAGLAAERCLNRWLRLRWLRTREGSASRDDLPSQNREISHSPPDTSLSLSHHLLPRFLHLSSRIQPPECDLSLKWIEIVCGIMLQASIEILDDPNLLSGDTETAKFPLEMCCAWGYIARKHYSTNSSIAECLASHLHAEGTELPEQEAMKMIQQTLSREDEIWEMFDDDVESLAVSQDHSPWMKARRRTRTLIFDTLNAMEEDSHDKERLPVKWLSKQHSLSTFVGQLHHFLKTSWQRLHSAEWEGQPILIQIEQGGLEGLDAEEFESFRVKAGIEHDRYFGA